MTPTFPASVAATPMAVEIDHLFYGLLIVSALVLALVFGLLTLFAVRYRAGSATHRTAPARSWWWEVSWTGATLAAFIGLFFWGANLYMRLYRAPPGTLDLTVVAKQWMWKIQHPEGQREINALHVPAGRPVRLIMTSQDVIHSFYVPAFRLKRDVLPGRYETMWFQADKTGTFALQCAEFCGTDHSAMGGTVTVMTPQDYQRWLGEQGGTETLAASGEALFRGLGCSGCHGVHADARGGTLTGSTVHAPDLAGLYGRPVPLADGGVVTADDQYIRDSILHPKAQIAAGYPPVMPSFAGKLDEDQLLDLLAYIKSLSPKALTGQPGGPP